MRKFLITAALTALILLTPSLTAASATTRPANTEYLCDSVTGPLCLLGHGIDTAETADTTGDPSIVLLAANVCSGTDKVNEHTSCPFKPGSGLNTYFNGDTIVYVQMSRYTNGGLCAGINSAAVVTGRDCPGHGSDTTGDQVVLQPSGGVTGHFVSVWLSDYLGGAAYMVFDSTSGDPARSTLSLNGGYSKFALTG